MGSSPSYFKVDNLPIEEVSWYDAVEFCNKKSDKEGLTRCYSGSGENTKCNFSANGYRLPTEAEWEYAARGGVKMQNSASQKYSGSNNIDEVAWYRDNSNVKTHPVGQKQANELGIHDMSGNVWEWCNDSYSSSYYVNNPTGLPAGSTSVLRGGSWLNSVSPCRVASRNWINRNLSSSSYGFRIVRNL